MVPKVPPCIPSGFLSRPSTACPRRSEAQRRPSTCGAARVVSTLQARGRRFDPTAPTRSEHMWIFKKIDCGFKVVPLVQPEVWIPGVPAMRGASFEHRNGHECTDPEFDRHCAGRWRGSVSLGFDADGNPDPPEGDRPDEDGG